MLDRLAGSSRILATAHGGAQRGARNTSARDARAADADRRSTPAAWERVPLPGLPTVKHVFPGLRRAPARGDASRRWRASPTRSRQSYDGPLDVAGCSLGAMVAHAPRDPPSRPRALAVRRVHGPVGGPGVDGAARRRRRGARHGGRARRHARALVHAGGARAAPRAPRGVAYARERLLALDPHCLRRRLARDRRPRRAARALARSPRRRRRSPGRPTPRRPSSASGHQRARAGRAPGDPRRAAHDAARAAGRVRRGARRAPREGRV